jgi:hypothetical protein
MDLRQTAPASSGCVERIDLRLSPSGDNQPLEPIAKLFVVDDFLFIGGSAVSVNRHRHL